MKRCSTRLCASIALFAMAAANSAMPATVQAKQILHFWHNWGGAGGQVMAELINRYNRTHKDVEVKVTQSGDTYQKLLASTAAGNPPDVVVLDRYLTANYAARNILLDISAYAKRDNLKASDFFAAAWQEVLLNGKVYGLPMTTDCRTLWYNTWMFQKAGLDPKRPPKTWFEVSQINSKLTIRDAAGNLIQAGYVPTWEQGNVKLMYIWQNGGDIFNADATKVAYNSQESIEALRWVVDTMAWLGPGVGKLGTGGATFAMYKEKLAMVLNGPWMQSEIVKNASREFKEHVEYAPVPYFKKPAVLAGGMGLIIPAGSKKKALAWDLAKFIVSFDQQVFFGDANGAIPALKAAAGSKEYLKDPFRRVHVDNMDVTRARPAHPAFPDVETLMNSAIDQALSRKKGLEQAIAGTIGPAQRILDAMNARYMKRR